MNKYVKKIFLAFLVWRISLFFAAFFATFLIPNFGGRFPYSDKILSTTGLPSWIWVFGNFDGVHYLKIAQEGYLAEYSQAFFPLFPVSFFWLGNIFTNFINYYLSFFLAGFLLSNIFFICALLILYKLFRLDFDHRTSLISIFLLISFPTAFYFGSIYTESLFLLLSAASFYLMRKKHYLLSGLFIGLASATRLVGVAIIIPLIVEFFLNYKNKGTFNISQIVGSIFLSFLGLGGYMYFLYYNFGNAFYFLTAQPVFGAERSIDKLILLPQVFFRYFKIFTTIPINSSTFFTAGIEFIFTLVGFTLLIAWFKKIRFSYWLFMFISFLLPTLTGTFSSMPRYALVLYLLFPLLVSSKRYIYIISSVFIIFQIILVLLFTRGYWVA